MWDFLTSWGGVWDFLFLLLCDNFQMGLCFRFCGEFCGLVAVAPPCPWLPTLPHPMGFPGATSFGLPALSSLSGPEKLFYPAGSRGPPGTLCYVWPWGFVCFLANC